MEQVLKLEELRKSLSPAEKRFIEYGRGDFLPDWEEGDVLGEIEVIETALTLFHYDEY